MINAAELKKEQHNKVKEVINEYIDNELSIKLKENALKGKYKIASEVIDIDAGLYQLIKSLVENIEINQTFAIHNGINLFEDILEANGFKIIAEYTNTNKLYDIYISW